LEEELKSKLWMEALQPHSKNFRGINYRIIFRK